MKRSETGATTAIKVRLPFDGKENLLKANEIEIDHEPAIFPKAQTACSATFADGLVRSRTNGATAPTLTTALV